MRKKVTKTSKGLAKGTNSKREQPCSLTALPCMLRRPHGSCMPIDQTDGHGNRYILMVASRLTYGQFQNAFFLFPQLINIDIKTSIKKSNI